jgi:hypothetical protein
MQPAKAASSETLPDSGFRGNDDQLGLSIVKICLDYERFRYRLQ